MKASKKLWNDLASHNLCKGHLGWKKMHGNRWKPFRWPEKANATHNENLGRFRFQPAAT